MRPLQALDAKLRGEPEQIVRPLLLVTGVILVLLALFASPSVVAIALAWAWLP